MLCFSNTLLFFNSIFISVQLLYSVVFISVVEQSESATYAFLFLNILSLFMRKLLYNTQGTQSGALWQLRKGWDGVKGLGDRLREGKRAWRVRPAQAISGQEINTTSYSNYPPIKYYCKCLLKDCCKFEHLLHTILICHTNLYIHIHNHLPFKSHEITEWF